MYAYKSIFASRIPHWIPCTTGSWTKGSTTTSCWFAFHPTTTYRVSSLTTRSTIICRSPPPPPNPPTAPEPGMPVYISPTWTPVRDWALLPHGSPLWPFCRGDPIVFHPALTPPWWFPALQHIPAVPPLPPDPCLPVFIQELVAPLLLYWPFTPLTPALPPPPPPPAAM